MELSWPDQDSITQGVIMEGSFRAIYGALAVGLRSEHISGWSSPLRENVIKHPVMEFPLRFDHKLLAEGVCKHISASPEGRM